MTRKAPEIIVIVDIYTKLDNETLNVYDAVRRQDADEAPRGPPPLGAIHE
jgi:hypothetical protein